MKLYTFIAVKKKTKCLEKTKVTVLEAYPQVVSQPEEINGVPGRHACQAPDALQCSAELDPRTDPLEYLLR